MKNVMYVQIPGGKKESPSFSWSICKPPCLGCGRLSKREVLAPTVKPKAKARVQAVYLKTDSWE